MSYSLYTDFHTKFEVTVRAYKILPKSCDAKPISAARPNIRTNRLPVIPVLTACMHGQFTEIEIR